MQKIKPLFSFFQARKRLLLPTVIIGVLLVGPLTHYLGAVLMFGMGFTSNVMFAKNGLRLLSEGALIGGQIITLCLLLRCNPLWCAVANGVFMVVTEYQRLILSLTPEQVLSIGLRPFVGILVINTCMAALAGFLTAWLAWKWVNRQSEQQFPRPTLSPSPSKARGAFTMVEMLVVLAIIGVLAALLFPAFDRAREKGRQTTCTSNLHQLGLAATMYMDDSNGVRPLRFQNLWDSGLIKSKQVLLCPDDPTGNWGGLIYESDRKSMHPELPPETVRYSYDDAFGLTDWEWDDLRRSQGSSGGLLICQMHGIFDDSLNEGTNWQGKPEVGDYQGLILRLQLDGAVVRRRFICSPQLMSDGTTIISHDYWPLFSDLSRKKSAQ